MFTFSLQWLSLLACIKNSVSQQIFPSVVTSLKLKKVSSLKQTQQEYVGRYPFTTNKNCKKCLTLLSKVKSAVAATSPVAVPV